MIPLAIAGAVGAEEIMTLLGYALATAGATYFANKFLQDKQQSDVFGSSGSSPSVPSPNTGEVFDTPAGDVTSVGPSDDATQVVDVLPGVNTGDVFSSDEGVSSDEVSSVSSPVTSEGGSEGVSSPGSSSVSVPSSVSTGGSLIDVLSSGVGVNARGFAGVVDALNNLVSSVRGLRVDSSGLDVLSQKVSSLEATLREGFSDLSRQLQAITLALSAQTLALQNTGSDVKVEFPDLMNVKVVDTVSVDLPQEVKESAQSTKRVMDLLSQPIEVNPEEIITGGTPIEVVAKGIGVQAKTFADINSFELSDEDIPDLPGSVDLSKIFQFLKVSSQLGGGSS